MSEQSIDQWPSLRQRLAILMKEHAGSLADEFYRELLRDQEASAFLGHATVREHLQPSLARWLQRVFPDSAESALGEADAKAEHRRIGNAHARSGVPLHLVQRGLAVLKSGVFHRLLDTMDDRADLVEAIILADDAMDAAVSLFNEQYSERSLQIEGSVQALRVQMTGQNLAMDVETLRARLFDWQRHSLTSFYDAWLNGCQAVVESPNTTDFALWVEHKGEIMFGTHPDVQALRTDRASLNDAFEDLRAACDDHDRAAFDAGIRHLNETVTRVGWHLGELVRHAMDFQNLRDPLTGVLSRRYLPHILRQQVIAARSGDAALAVVMIDIDHFKKINDQHGHAAGDGVLSQFSNIAQGVIRSSDFVFRLGGEEFLLLLSGANVDHAMAVAEKLRLRVAEHPFLVADDRLVRITISAGVAEFDQHPDYERLLRRADTALYTAKQDGRNRVATVTMTS